MKIGNFHIPFTKKEEEAIKESVKESQSSKDILQSNSFTEGFLGGWRGVSTYSFDGEKTPGELGAPINLVPDYLGLRLRAYEAELKSDVVKIITGKFFKWVVGDGLKLQPQPNEKTLQTEGIEIDWVKFRTDVEARFKSYSESNYSDYSSMDNLHSKASESFDTSFLGGDCLVILRVDENLNPNVQVIDGQHVCNPILTAEEEKELKDNKYRIKHGVILDSKNKHVGFYVKKDCETGLEWQKVDAYGEKSGLLMAYMIYGKKHRIDHVRGIPNISSILEKVDKLDRYTEASVGAAEERAKVPWFIEHNQHSDGENPLIDVVKASSGSGDTSKSSYDLAEVTKKEVYISQQKTVTNLPIGATMKALFSQAEINYDSFFKSIFIQLCAACDIPPEVALQKYDSNYSASRAAINGWGYIIDIYRKKHARKFYKNFYKFWLYCEVLKNKIEAPGYVKAVEEKNHLIVEAYTEGLFLGINLPHIDPLKEVKAVREMIGDKSKGQVPLISLDMATEQLNNGDWKEIYKKYSEEMELTDGEFEVKEPEPVIVEKPSEKPSAKEDKK